MRLSNDLFTSTIDASLILRMILPVIITRHIDEINTKKLVLDNLDPRTGVDTTPPIPIGADFATWNTLCQPSINQLDGGCILAEPRFVSAIAKGQVALVNGAFLYKKLGAETGLYLGPNLETIRFGSIYHPITVPGIGLSGKSDPEAISWVKVKDSHFNPQDLQMILVLMQRTYHFE